MKTITITKVLAVPDEQWDLALEDAGNKKDAANVFLNAINLGLYTPYDSPLIKYTVTVN